MLYYGNKFGGIITMKKLLILLTTGVLCLTSLTACGKPQLDDDWGSNVTYWEDVTPEDNWWEDELYEEVLEEEIIEEEIIEEEES